ncbi:hypothetical protein M4S82_15675 [Planococcus sp. MERTA32b]|nr:hypothetical protein [Planococcus sp. MER TA 32b]
MEIQLFIENNDHHYDFKNESPKEEVKHEKNPVKKLLKYKINGSSFDCDRSELARNLYNKMWRLSNEQLANYDSDTMNSFYRIYRLLLLAYDVEQGNLYWKLSGISNYKLRYKWLLDEYDYYKEINEHKEVQKFAALTHSIGNFTLVPKGFNTKRNALFDDYWDITLEYFKKEFGEDTFLQHCQKFKYIGAYLDNSQIQTYWDGHAMNNKKLPSSFNTIQILEVIKKINRSIEIRGKEMLQELTNMKNL